MRTTNAQFQIVDSWFFIFVLGVSLQAGLSAPIFCVERRHKMISAAIPNATAQDNSELPQREIPRKNQFLVIIKSSTIAPVEASDLQLSTSPFTSITKEQLLVLLLKYIIGIG